MKQKYLLIFSIFLVNSFVQGMESPKGFLPEKGSLANLKKTGGLLKKTGTSSSFSELPGTNKTSLPKCNSNPDPKSISSEELDSNYKKLVARYFQSADPDKLPVAFRNILKKQPKLAGDFEEKISFESISTELQFKDALDRIKKNFNQHLPFLKEKDNFVELNFRINLLLMLMCKMTYWNLKEEKFPNHYNDVTYINSLCKFYPISEQQMFLFSHGSLLCELAATFEEKNQSAPEVSKCFKQALQLFRKVELVDKTGEYKIQPTIAFLEQKLKSIKFQ